MAVTIRIVRSDGLSWSCGTGTLWAIPEKALKDWNVLDYDVVTSDNVMRDGASVLSRRVSSKDRTLTAVYKGRNAALARANAISFFNSDYEFQAHVTYMGRTRWCEGVQIGFKPSTLRVTQAPEVTWTLLCPDPFMRDENGNEAAFGTAKAMRGFPFVSHLRETLPDGTKYPAGSYPSALIYDGRNTVVNNGDRATRYKVRVEAGGDLVNPTLTKDGKRVRLLLTMVAGDVLEIDFEAHPAPTVKLNGESAIMRATPDSSFSGMEMKVGENVFTFDIDNDENRSLARVQVLFHAKYTAV